jgi:hypothetical protein
MLRFGTIIVIIIAGSCGVGHHPSSSARPMRPGFSVGARAEVFTGEQWFPILDKPFGGFGWIGF